ncbi:MAG: ABC transporter ATP-binding protein [Alphaproteobacteria bacterium]|nr:ABC transporter ATP-binding protein [Alphaproteobacteria bacterium]
MSAAAPFFRVSGLSKMFSGVRAIDDLSFDLERGSITGLIGPNGSGKSTTIDCLSRFQSVDNGSWWLEGRELSHLPRHAIARAGMSRTFQAVRTYDSLSLMDNLGLAAQEHEGVRWWDALVHGRAARSADDAARLRTAELLEIVGLTRLAESPAAVLSYGQRKLLSIAAAMMAAPKLVLLDEPVAGVNPTMVLRIEALLRLFRDRGVTLLLVEHNMGFVMRLCQRVIVLETGRILADGDPSAVRDDPRVLDAYIGRSAAGRAA